MAPPPGHPRFPLIDALRGGAILFIVVAHGVALSGGIEGTWYRGLFAHNIGLAMFFMVSGFVIYRPFAAHRVLGARNPGVKAYARRRFLRILPAYWLALTVLAIYPGIAGVFTDQWWVFYGLLQLFPIYDTTQCAQADLGCGIATAATLPGELGFYVMLPFYALLLAALAKRPIGERWLRTELLLLLVLSVASLGLRAWAATQVPPEPFLFYGVTGTFWWLAVGMGMAAISVALQGREDDNRIVALIARHPWSCWLAGAGIFVGLAIAYPTPMLFGSRPDPVDVVVEFVALGVGGGLFLLTAVFGERGGGVPRRILANPVLGWVGVISYGLYLYHLPIQEKLREAGLLDVFPDSALMLPAISLPLAVLSAAASYYFFERPILRFKEPRARRARR